MPAIIPSQAEPPLVLALDVGTSSARGLLYDRQGRALEGTVGTQRIPSSNQG